MYLSEKAAAEYAEREACCTDLTHTEVEMALKSAFIEGAKWERERTVKLIEAITAAQNAAMCINNAVRQIVGGFSGRDLRL
jgi:hypothetical protein